MDDELLAVLPSPAILERLETKRAIESDRTIAVVLGLARGADNFPFAVATTDHASAHVENGYLSREDIRELGSRSS